MKHIRRWAWPGALAVLATGPALGASVAYTLEPGHTQVVFQWNHMQFSNPNASFDDVTGTLMWDADDITRSSVQVDIAAASLHSHLAALDEKLKSPAFLDVARYPAIRFASTRVEKVDATHLRVTGDLTAHGVTRPAVLDVTINRVGIYPFLKVPAAGFDATTTLKRSDFGVGEGVPVVGDELSVRITAEALEAVGYAAAMKAIAAGQTPKE